MDDSMVDPAFNIAKTLQDQGPAAPAMQSSLGPDAPDQGQKRPSRGGSAFFYVPLVLIIVIVGWYFLVANRTSTLPFGLSPAPSTCPCLTEQQLAGLSNVTASQTTAFNITAVGSSRWKQDEDAQGSVFLNIPTQVKDSVTGVWLENYATGTTTNTPQTANLATYQASNASGFYLGLAAAMLPKSHPQNNVDGFTYSYYELNSSNSTGLQGQVEVLLVGYKGDYVVDGTFYLIQPNVILQARLPLAIAKSLNSTL